MCPLNTYGTRCGLIYDQCKNDPCQNNGTCYPSTSNLTKANCICQSNYYGDYCQSKKNAIYLTIDRNNISGVSVVQYFYIEFTTLDLVLAQQDVSDQPFQHLHYRYANSYSPQIVPLRNYPNESTTYSNIFLLSLTIKEKNINSSTNLTNENLCLNIAESLKNIHGEFFISKLSREDI